MRKSLIIGMGLTLSLLLILNVNYAKGPKNNMIRVPGDYGTIKEAVDAADPGATIMVGPGYWAGAVVDKPVTIKGKGKAVINYGPKWREDFGLTVGFLFPGGKDKVGSGTTISNFTFECYPQDNKKEDDGSLDFPIFSRGADNVTVEHCVMKNSLQAITNWHGNGWKIIHNDIEGLYALQGGGIGIFIGAILEIPANNNFIAHNKIEAEVNPDLDYTTVGITLCSDARWKWAPGGPVRNNKVIHNYSCVIGMYKGEPAGVGFELTDWPLMDSKEATVKVKDNKIGFNDFRGSSIEIGINPEEAEDNNVISRNLGENRGHGVHPIKIFK